ncbi:hypothetical protein SAMN04487926_12170 [Paraburkholderia steynii]|uniref:Uncharacterized protein n=1 Tax=Paraburkholderia steynii TaxID=1245441 RepID=A0A7Z7BD13_9BURK|nr:hypothetical protein [Paraburkholderia steynii]SDI65585.1 hypothetical protein SAMN04487926_12170 [Paraburkholderia steynii]
MKAIAAALALVSLSAFAGPYGAAKQLPDGNMLMVVPRSPDCGGKAAAVIVGKDGEAVDHSCAIQQSAEGITVAFRNRAPITVRSDEAKLFAVPPVVAASQ